MKQYRHQGLLPTEESSAHLQLVERVALCLPCEDISSLEGFDSDPDDYIHNEIDASFCSRESISPMAKALGKRIEEYENDDDDDDEVPKRAPPSTTTSRTTTPTRNPRRRRRRQQQHHQQRQRQTPPSQHSASKIPCRFFHSKNGCRNGSSCLYDHSPVAAANAVAVIL